jgi:hypothetical protein
VLSTAARYAGHVWMPEQRHVFHGVDDDGVEIHTPDATAHGVSQSPHPGWWTPGVLAVGMPYQWGGFATPEEFDRALRLGRYAGDIATPEKREKLDAAVSSFCTGIDCSGFVSRCWGLAHAHSTRELESVSRRLVSATEVLPGDAFNLFNSHVVLVAGWADAARTRLRIYEAASPPSSGWGKVALGEVTLASLEERGFIPLRYLGVIG